MNANRARPSAPALVIDPDAPTEHRTQPDRPIWISEDYSHPVSIGRVTLSAKQWHDMALAQGHPQAHAATEHRPPLEAVCCGRKQVGISCSYCGAPLPV